MTRDGGDTLLPLHRGVTTQPQVTPPAVPMSPKSYLDVVQHHQRPVDPAHRPVGWGRGHHQSPGPPGGATPKCCPFPCPTPCPCDTPSDQWWPLGVSVLQEMSLRSCVTFWRCPHARGSDVTAGSATRASRKVSPCPHRSPLAPGSCLAGGTPGTFGGGIGEMRVCPRGDNAGTGVTKGDREQG